MKTTVCEMKNTRDGINSRLEIAEEKISIFEMKIKKKIKINQQSTSELWGKN